MLAISYAGTEYKLARLIGSYHCALWLKLHNMDLFELKFLHTLAR